MYPILFKYPKLTARFLLLWRQSHFPFRPSDDYRFQSSCRVGRPPFCPFESKPPDLVDRAACFPMLPRISARQRLRFG